jgi:hypothetical protein
MLKSPFHNVLGSLPVCTEGNAAEHGVLWESIVTDQLLAVQRTLLNKVIVHIGGTLIPQKMPLVYVNALPHLLLDVGPSLTLCESGLIPTWHVPHNPLVIIVLHAFYAFVLNMVFSPKGSIALVELSKTRIAVLQYISAILQFS